MFVKWVWFWDVMLVGDVNSGLVAVGFWFAGNVVLSDLKVIAGIVFSD